MTIMLAVAIVFATAALGLSASPTPPDPKHDPRVAFAETDLNHDGVVDHEEYQRRITEVFFSADANKDGFLDPTELKQLAFPDDFTATDKDKNGRLSLHEFLRVRFHDFEVADRNDDGVLSLEEVVEAFEGRKRS
jgi:Ca2+-binding EF-hand superfamily protein